MANNIKKIFWKMLPKKIYALVGPPGTGKSFRAFLIADKYHIEYIIDDGLLIHDQQIIAGKSAKDEQYHVSAVKCAIFHDQKHAREVRHALVSRHYTSVLILGTSENMVNKICLKLHLPKPRKIIRIEDIATEEEIRIAQRSRLKDGAHVIPIPMIEVKKTYPNIVMKEFVDFITAPKQLFSRRKKTPQGRKTIVRPNFGSDGKISISETALLQMVSHCVQEYSTEVRLQKVSVNEQPSGFSLGLDIYIDYTMNTPEALKQIQKIVKDKIEQFTGIPIQQVDINIKGSYNEI